MHVFSCTLPVLSLTCESSRTGMHFRVVFESSLRCDATAHANLHNRLHSTYTTHQLRWLPTAHAWNPIALQAIYAEGKEHALAVGITRMSTDDMCVSCAPARLPPNPSHAALSARFSVATSRTGVFRFGPMRLCRTGWVRFSALQLLCLPQEEDQQGDRRRNHPLLE